jgi:hypothetical protein
VVGQPSMCRLNGTGAAHKLARALHTPASFFLYIIFNIGQLQ